MFHLECVICLVIIIYSLFYQLRVVITYNKNKKITFKDGSGLFVSKDILNKNDLDTLYVTKINGKYNDHYDIERNVIRLSEEVYDKSNLSSMAISFYHSLTAIYYNKRKTKKEDKMKALIIDWANKVAFVLFILGAASKAIDVMTLSLIVMGVVIVIKYNNINNKIELLEDNINYLKKEYKLKKDNLVKLENNIKLLMYNELSLHIFNNKY